MEDVYLGLGSNLGDRGRLLADARRALQQPPEIHIVEASALYETTPVGGPPDQPPYLNAVLRLATNLPPQHLLERCQQLESRYGRVRQERWGARTLDIDILLYGSRIVDEPQLSIPHPRLHLRRFVLVPLVELAPELVHPLLRRSCRKLLDALPETDGVELFTKDW